MNQLNPSEISELIKSRIEKFEARAEARKRYEALAARAAEDGGASVWPQAARWRLRWWQD